MHGHQLRLLAEQEHVTLWTDITVGALYGAIKRLGAEGLIAEERTEREGAYPERQVWAITDAGRTTLSIIQHDALRAVVVKPDPFDLAMTRLDKKRLDALPAMIDARVQTLSAMLSESETHGEIAQQYLTASERFVMRHKADRLRAELAWHRELQAELPTIIADERTRDHD
ncbi:PadR family transcriptional regulator [Cellulomonas sp. McL0617]|uniref:PadR family transcriptional regulator n=1 Tax=Cellulomonas sp. McL0617 TaxID=3415675 RepID=UPI003CF1CD6D